MKRLFVTLGTVACGLTIAAAAAITLTDDEFASLDRR